MFRKREAQGSLFETSNLIPPEKAARLAASWAEAFRTRALPLIDEERFAPMYCADNGAPNRAVEIVLGVLILKEMFDLTDEEALGELEFDLRWHVALRLRPEEAHLCQKTLHNFRAGLVKWDVGRVAFRETTDGIIAALGIATERQRLDSTHILSNMATLTRLGLFCETIRVFLKEVRREHPRLAGDLPARLLRRYLKEDDTDTAYADARQEEARRRLPVAARDAWRLTRRYAKTTAERLEGYRLLLRLLGEQCEFVGQESRPGGEDDDAGEGPAPLALREPKDIRSDTLQSPHDPGATYSAHKGKGYEVQVAETCHEANPVEVITHVEVTPSSGSDAGATIPAIEVLKERGIQPAEMVADTTYGSGANAVEAERLGTELVSPVGGSAPKEAEASEGARPLTAADFKIDVRSDRPATCPAGQTSTGEEADPEDANRVWITFAKGPCEACALRARCPVKMNAEKSGYVLAANLAQVNIECRRRAEARGEFRPRYAIRAGIEATNSELKRRHGLGHLRVRGRPRVELAVYLKALACNVKRMVNWLVEEAAARAARPVVAAA